MTQGAIHDDRHPDGVASRQLRSLGHGARVFPATLGMVAGANHSTYGRDLDDDPFMSTHSIAEAASQLPGLIDRALKGESVIICRDGQPVVELRPVPVASRLVTKADIDWLDAHRVGKARAGLDAATEVRRMRDDGA